MPYFNVDNIFQATNPAALAKKYRKDKLIPVIDESTTSRVLADLLRKLLKKSPKERIEFGMVINS